MSVVQTNNEVITEVPAKSDSNNLFPVFLKLEEMSTLR